ncbi:hypothetical protein [Streptomyces violascens]|uniref:hypothetical protein n=1 Tax=Streptomyces violascens TaxID=67381 RepID=UPI00369A325A
MRDYLNRFLGLVDSEGAFLNPFHPGNVRRAAQEGARDVGDIHAVPFILECKDVRNPAVPTWLRQAEIEAENAGFPYGVVVHKMRGAGVRYGRVHVAVETCSRIRRVLDMPAPEFYGAYGFTLNARGLDTSRWYFSATVWDLAHLIDDYRGTVGAWVSARAAR